ncbi:DNA-directed RNA polymerases I, II, and III subunit RPABC3 [Melipona quadrifasciata]|uniref:DNA-directed RNA polymerases I, II, and III subunit RPABC3 n=1 Tax=Melipona quadrifasciata TaxID=166423 RepID=A0A0M9A6Q8_9HYME|nr:DNA-directed RNA polymerases I, II, and III subunit RPABC3 [Melipona quadrifasciata]
MRYMPLCKSCRTGGIRKCAAQGHVTLQQTPNPLPLNIVILTPLTDSSGCMYLVDSGAAEGVAQTRAEYLQCSAILQEHLNLSVKIAERRLTDTVGLDSINCEFHLKRGDKFRLVLATTLREDGYPDVGEWNATEQEGGSRADSFEYVMSGMVYRIEGDEANNEPSSRLKIVIKITKKNPTKRAIMAYTKVKVIDCCKLELVSFLFPKSCLSIIENNCKFDQCVQFIILSLSPARLKKLLSCIVRIKCSMGRLVPNPGDFTRPTVWYASADIASLRNRGVIVKFGLKTMKIEVPARDVPVFSHATGQLVALYFRERYYLTQQLKFKVSKNNYFDKLPNNDITKSTSNKLQSRQVDLTELKSVFQSMRYDVEAFLQRARNNDKRKFLTENKWRSIVMRKGGGDLFFSPVKAIYVSNNFQELINGNPDCIPYCKIIGKV